ncbi:hypothetical protein [Dokdonella soli]|uniref:Uncharacterized protein n=1 Tax=Dokdonella soli TaxID=529810 RepID=A0ABN1IEL8_9GAMM
METAKRAGRTIGTLLLQMAGSALVNFVLLDPINQPPGFLVNAVAHAQQIGLAVLIGLATSALSVGIAITA